MLLLFACHTPEKETADTGETAVDTAPDTESGETADSGHSEEETDTGETGDTGTKPDPDWLHCPDGGAYVGEQSWTALLQATRDAVYCSMPNEARTLELELELKAQMKVVEGSWPVPAAEGTYNFALPTCTRRIDPMRQPDMTGGGSTEVSPTTYSGTTYTLLEGGWPMASPDGTSWSLAHSLLLVGDEGATPAPLVVDGTIVDPSTGAGSTFYLYEDGQSRYDVEAITFGPCTDTTLDLNRHTVVFAGGAVDIELWLGPSFDLTGPSIFARASGTLDGTSFDVTEFFQLIYRPGHHHFDRHFAILFDAPIAGACALRVEDIDDLEGTTTAVVSTAACDLSVIEARKTKSEDWVIE